MLCEAKVALGIICDNVDGGHVIICQALQLVLLAKLDFEPLLANYSWGVQYI